MKIPLVDLQPQYASIREDVLPAIAPICGSRQERFRRLAHAADGFPNAAAAGVLALPIHPELTAAQQEHAVRSIAEVVG